MKKENSTTQSGKSPILSAGTSNSHKDTATSRAFVKRVLNFSQGEKLIQKGDRILLALSGGPDSTALLYFFLSLKEKYSLALFAAHVNYQLRKKDSDADEAFVRELCARHHIPLFLNHPNPKKTDEETLRTIRYAFFEKVRTKERLNTIAVAHNRDDQAETLLLRLLRGSGPEGLRAMTPRYNTIIRPFLATSRKDILHFLKEKRIPYRIDQTNLGNAYLRNRIRNRLIPYLEKNFQPNVKNILARTATLLSEQDRNTTRFENLIQEPKVPHEHHGSFTDVSTKTLISVERVSFSRRTFLGLPKAMQSDILRKLYRDITRSPLNPPHSFVRECRKLLESAKSKPQSLSRGQLKLEARGDKVTLMRM